MSSRFCAALLLALSFGALARAGDARVPRRTAAVPQLPVSHRVAFMGYLRDGRVATVYADGRVTIAPPRAASGAAKRGRPLRASSYAVTRQHVPVARYGSLAGDVAPAVRRQILFDLEHPPQRYVPERVVVAFAPNVTMARDSDALAPAAAQALRAAVLAKRRDVSPHPFTNDARTNSALTSLGVDRADRLFAHADRASLNSMRVRAEARVHRALIPFDNAFVLHVGAASVPDAVRRLRALPGVAYAAPDHVVSSMIAERRPVTEDTLREIAGYHRAAHAFGRSTRSATSAATVPSNTAVSLNLQALLNAPGVDAVAAFDEIGARFNQLPGTGEIITNVGLGDADDASAAANANDPCNAAVASSGPTTRMVGGQRYLDWPSLPLIPVWVSDANANLSPTAEVCDVDSQLGEVGLDFSVMAPLPDALQRPGKTAPFAMDLLGIAPGASYRWVAPGSTAGVVGTSDTIAAMLAAAHQQPAPNVITASIGFGVDGFGFPGRYLEDDPLVQSAVAGIVASNVVVCIAANDGTRMLTTAAIGPSGGSAPTNTGTTGLTNINDVAYTTAPSVVPDSGAIDVGATTLDDIFSANPRDPAQAALANVKAFPETRYNGQLGYSSGFGSRVNVSAPGDNVDAFYRSGTDADAVGLESVGGTSASAPEVAAAAAIALQVARLTGHPLASAAQVRDLLVATGTPVANPPQSDVPLNVGPQVSVRRVVEQLLATAGHPVQPGIARVAVQGRRTGNVIAFYNERYANDAFFTAALDPSYIKLDGPYTRAIDSTSVAWPGSDTGADLNSYVTLAPDWEGIPGQRELSPHRRGTAVARDRYDALRAPAARPALRRGRRRADAGGDAHAVPHVPRVGRLALGRGVDVRADVRTARAELAARARPDGSAGRHRRDDPGGVRRARLPGRQAARPGSQRVVSRRGQLAVRRHRALPVLLDAAHGDDRHGERAGVGTRGCRHVHDLDRHAAGHAGLRLGHQRSRVHPRRRGHRPPAGAAPLAAARHDDAAAHAGSSVQVAVRRSVRRVARTGRIGRDRGALGPAPVADPLRPRLSGRLQHLPQPQRQRAGRERRHHRLAVPRSRRRARPAP